MANGMIPNYGMQYPAPYQNGSYSYGNMQASNYGQQMPQQYTQSEVGKLEWVDGEVGAKAFSMPRGWPPNVPVALWDTNDCVIYLKSINNMGMPNPLQKIHYTMDDQQQPALLNGNSYAAPDYATKDDFRALKEDFKSLKEVLLASMANNSPKPPMAISRNGASEK